MSSKVSTNKEVFRPHEWGNGYFDINDKGEVVVSLSKGPVSLNEVVRRLRRFGFDLPAVVRFPDLITLQAQILCSTFEQAIKEFGYRNHFTGVYPLKVNPMAHVLKTFIQTTNFGLEAGSKAELLAALSLALPNQSRPVLVNGHKDDVMLQAILEAAHVGYRVIPIIEKLDEVHRLLRMAKRLKTSLKFGVRVRLHAKGQGKWEDSAGERAKFGLSTAEILELVSILKEHDFLDSWELMHFHIGSQVTGIRQITGALKEASRIFCRLWQLGVPLKTLDVGGGLGIDYDGSRSNTDSSMNYSIEEYANNVIYTVGEICREENVPEPEIISESGRWLVAYHAILLVESLGRNSVLSAPVPKRIPKEHDLVRDMRTCLLELKKSNVLESLHDARSLKEDCLHLFDLGYLRLEERSSAETLYWNILKKAYKYLRGKEKTLCAQELADQIIVNFSLFQSLPDYWAVEHNFPIMPIDGLNKSLSREATLCDITCDSDGKINSFIDSGGRTRNTLPVHDDQEGHHSFGIFLIGAYQDILGDLHNLFGPLNEVEVTWPKKSKSFNVGKLDKGSDVEETLVLMHMDPKKLTEQLLKSLTSKCQTNAHKKRIQNHFKKMLKDSTYFDLRP